MVSNGGFEVDPAELRKFASYLSDTAHAEIVDAANGVHSANGFDNSAFGIFAAQILAIPARIAMAAVTDNLNKLADEISQAAQSTVTAATTYQQHEESVTRTLNTISPGDGL
ncbi:MAG: hypothetical protein JWQ81_3626 [Amycolatopsis sp.]|jgi:hypothetical protein|uniref:type VII secretion target n=1 Tax=Amycolatopsis sp. TaxID=37632 RepID=UPI002633E0E2|nr:type VII secretion target [Amycolatopsis sp.]MCU1682887.1 hypothetical protein [Amycolatopsis sp.]